MTDERLVRSLAIALDDLAAARTPDYLEAAIERASSRPQRPASTFPERWLPMDLVTRRQILAPNVPWRTLGTLALLALLIAAVLAAYVGSQRRVPAPFGIAANGLVAFVDADGAILQADPLTGESDVIVPGPGNEGPIHSPDGTRLAYLRKDPVGRYDIVVAQADGQRPVVITTESLIAADYFGWAPTSATVVVSVPFGGLQTYDGSTPSAPRVMAFEGQSPGKGIDAFNADIRDIFRPPMGDEILYLGGTSAGPALFVANRDGTNARAIIDPEKSEIAYSDLDAPQWSPDGSRIAIALAPPDNPDNWRVHVVNADGTGLRELSRDPRPRSEGHPSWSPDGTRVAFQRWFINDACGPCVTRPITVVGVDDGVEMEVGIVNVDGYHGWSWSPDGQSILEVPRTSLSGDSRSLQWAEALHRSSMPPPTRHRAGSGRLRRWFRTCDEPLGGATRA